MISYEDFIKANLGKSVEREDPTNVDQCVDWAFAYLDDVLGVPRSAIRHLRAYQIWTDATDETRKYFDLIPNTATNTPQKGDLVVFDTTVGVSGHICLASGNVSGVDTFQSTDENWNGHLYIEYIWHSYNGVLGWLRPKTVTTTPIPTPSASGGALPANYGDIIKKSSNWDAVVAFFGITGDPKDVSLDQIKNIIAGLKSRITDLGNQLTLANAEVGNREEQTSRLKQQLLDSENLRKTLTDQSNQMSQRMSDTVATYEGYIKGKDASLKAQGAQIGDLTKQIALLRADNQKLKINVVGTLSISDLFAALAKRFTGK